MSLTGNLEVFPLEEVLRMLARTKKTGCLLVDTGSARGRVFVETGSLSFGTTVSDEEQERQLTNARLVTSEAFHEVGQRGTLSEHLAPGITSAVFADFVREQIVDTLFRLRRTAAGSFDFSVDRRPKAPTGQTFDLDVLISEADRRATEWGEVEEVVANLDIALRMVRTLPRGQEVSISAPSWELLANLGAGSSVRQVADTIGHSEFVTAREFAGLVRKGLVEAFAAPVAVPVAGVPSWQPPVDEPVAAVEEPVAQVEEPSFHVVQADVPVDEPVDEPVEEAAAQVDEPVDEPVEEAAAQVDEPIDEPVEEAAAQVDEPIDKSGYMVGITETETETEVVAEEPLVIAEEAAEEAADEVTPEVTEEAAEVRLEEPDRNGWAPAWQQRIQTEPQVPWAVESPIQQQPWVAETPVDPWIESAAPDWLESPVEPAAFWGSSTEDDVAAPEVSGHDAEPETPEDTDRFLETVFRQLDEGQTSEPSGEESGFGMGLLRRRRLGAVSREVPENKD